MSFARAAVFVVLAISLLAPVLADATTVKVTIRVIAADKEGLEFILARTEGRTFRTGRLTRRGEQKWQWDIGESPEDAYCYWNFFSGVADVSVQVDETVIFRGRCRGRYARNVRLADTCPNPLVYRTRGVPSIREPREEPISMLTLKTQ